MRRRENKPSRLALALFHWYCQSEYREEIEGDLTERFNKHTEKYGHNKANLLFMIDVVLLFRPSLVKNIFQLAGIKNMHKKRKRWYLIMAVVISGLLLIPLTAMIFTQEVNWKLNDFLIAGLLMSSAGLMLEYIVRKIKTRENKIVLGIALLSAFVLLWAELAVGIIGTPIAGN
ncbi:MAG: permease prefix domain 2-containing transporter [Bacteroidota bacterium]